MDRKVSLIGAAIDACGNKSGAAQAPLVLNQLLESSGNLKFEQIVNYSQSGQDIVSLASYFQQLALLVKNTYTNNHLPIVVGGDHSCAIGTWSGVYSALKNAGKSFGLIWFDAHMDAHTPATSQTGNIHGMPVATLLGHGFSELTSILDSNPKLKPEDIVLFGIRCYESGEAELLKLLGVKIYYIDEVNRLGLVNLFTKEWQRLSAKFDYVGLSIDLDGFDPIFAPGVSTPVPGGMDFNHFLDCLDGIDTNKLCGVEITEGNPQLDSSGKTIQCIADILAKFAPV
jgi:arginase